MITYTFNWGDDHRFGNSGWLLKGYPHFNSGVDVSHDILEHLPGGMKHGQYADECMALGARWLIRAETGQLGSGFSLPESVFGREIQHILEAMDQNGHDRILAPKNIPNLRAQNVWFPEDDIESEAIHFCECDGLGHMTQGNIVATMIDWMKVGYAAAQNRYRRQDPYSVYYFGEMIDKELRKYSRYGYYDDRLVITINESNLTFQMRHSSLYN